jgi:hypothetical protein
MMASDDMCLVNLWNRMLDSQMSSDKGFDVAIGRSVILKSVYNIVVGKKRYDLLAKLDPKAINQFIGHLIQIDCVDDLLKMLVTANRRKEAEQIVRLWKPTLTEDERQKIFP